MRSSTLFIWLNENVLFSFLEKCVLPFYFVQSSVLAISNSRHDNVRASSTLFIWLNENVLFSFLEKCVFSSVSPLQPVTPGVRWALGIAFFALFVAAWWLVTALGWVSPTFLASPAAMAREGVLLFTEYGFTKKLRDRKSVV